MAAFEYEALDASGKRTKGLLSADSESAARRELRARRLAPLAVTRADKASGASSNPLANLLGPRRIGASELMGITRQLATLINAGMPVEEAVGLVGGPDASAPARRALLNVRARVTEGERLSEAMAVEGRSFPAVYRSMIAAGEGAGGLGLVLDRLADYLEKAEALRRKVATALIYPAVLAVIALGVVVVLLTVIVPSISEQFDSMGMTLPFLTRTMIGVSGFLTDYGIWVLIGVLLAGLVGHLTLQRPAVRKVFHRVRLAIPLLGSLETKIEAARAARTLSILIASGAVLPDALRAARGSASNDAIKDKLTGVVDQVETGRGLADALRSARVFPALMLYMVAAGERSGRLSEMFERSAEHLEAEIDGVVTAGLSLLEPGIIIAMGGVVVLIVLSILLPILQLNTSVLV